MTLIEAMVALLLTGILIAIASGVFLYFHKGFSKQARIVSRLYDSSLLDQALSTDMVFSESYRLSETEVYCMRYKDRLVAHYVFSDHYVLRCHHLCDTFFVKAKPSIQGQQVRIHYIDRGLELSYNLLPKRTL